jgi:hypothetical protein
MTSKQKYHKDDKVHIKATLSRGMNHFPKDIDATILHTYNEEFPRMSYNGGDHIYCVMLANGNTSAWYDEDNFTPKDKSHE